MVAVCLCLLDQSPPPGPQDASPQPRQGHATVPLVVRQWVGSPPPPLRAPLPGPLPDRAGRGRDVSLGRRGQTDLEFGSRWIAGWCQQLADQRTQQPLAARPDVMNELKEPQVQRQTFLGNS